MTTDEKLDELTAKVEHLIGLIEGRSDRCKDHTDRIVRLENAVTKQNFIAAIFGAIGSALVIAARSMIGK